MMCLNLSFSPFFFFAFFKGLCNNYLEGGAKFSFLQGGYKLYCELVTNNIHEKISPFRLVTSSAVSF